MNSGSKLINALFIFVLAGFIGFEVIRRVSPLLHTPLMSLRTPSMRSRSWVRLCWWEGMRAGLQLFLDLSP